MSRIQALSDGLNSVFTDKKTGKLFIIVKQENSTRLGTIVVREGEIVGIEYSAARRSLNPLSERPWRNKRSLTYIGD